MVLKRKFVVFIIIEGLFLSVIFILGIKIVNLTQDKVKGVQYVTVIKKEDLIFNPDNHELKYFYEPRSNSIETWSPNWLGHEIQNTINSDSLNERYNYTLKKDNGTFRIITIGDSFTYGLFVETNKNYPEVLEDLLNHNINCNDIKQFEVINLGVPGYDVAYTVERFVKRGLKYHPDIVIYLLINWNFENVNEFYFPIKDRLMRSGVPEYISSDKDVTPIAAIQAAEEIQKKYGREAIFNKIHEALSRLSLYYKDKLFFINFPTLYTSHKNIIEEYLSLHKNFIHYDDLSVINSQESFSDGHPNSEGYKKIAKDIYSFLLTNLLKDKCVVSN